MSEPNLNVFACYQGKRCKWTMMSAGSVAHTSRAADVELHWDCEEVQCGAYVIPVEDLEGLRQLIGTYLMLRRGGEVGLG